jgi:hypothetical protein
MSGELRTPFLVAALVLAVLLVGAELGTSFFEGDPTPRSAMRAAVDDQVAKGEIDEDDAEDALEQMTKRAARKPPGLGVPYLALVDGLLLMTLLLVSLGVLVPERVHGRIQGLITLIVSLLVLLGSIGLAFLALGKLLVMVALLLATPFGTLAYVAVWGFFARPEAATILGFLLLLKVILVVCLVLAHQRFLQNKGLVLLLVTSLLANVIVAFLHGLVPLLLVSITDAVAAIVNAILAIVWALVLLIGALVSILKLLRLDRAS